MTIADTTRTRALLALAAGSLGAMGAVLGASWALTSPPPAPRPTATAPPPRPHGCGGARASAPRPHHGASAGIAYRDALRAGSAPMQACMTGDGTGTGMSMGMGRTVRLSIELDPAGRARSVEVRLAVDSTDATAISSVGIDSGVDLGLIKCLEAAVAQIEFPRAPHTVRISTDLRR